MEYQQIMQGEYVCDKCGKKCEDSKDLIIFCSEFIGGKK